ncbi:Calmodulin-binding receptor-like cytoplasmic kinase 1 [Geodia barretti]|uniref:Calmodulin-binding receptor-like cytoplasmic kinase 1 n=1 Tax=Geodia barretti TaxID=519541 RepID=A0AA35RF00_GEOBA|nr:Calmodulin-binding receptor-like cytoplasmic kinase 1 [Geodia barretti]
MELCQDNLTTYLDKYFESLAYHKKVSLLHDVALALVFLHAHGIVHGNLGSNNVFVVPYRLPRAKISDYGLCRMPSIVKHSSRYYRGNSAYLPPNPLVCLLKNAPKVDCYSWGVLATQMLTNQLPLPPPKPSEKVKGEQPINIEEHHKTILALVNSANPLLPIIKSSLRQLEGHRPPSDVISYSLAELKADRIYIDSVEKESKEKQQQQQQPPKREEKEKSMAGTSKLKKDLRESKMEVEKLRKELFGAGRQQRVVLRPTFSEDTTERRVKTMKFTRSGKDDEHMNRYGMSVPILDSNSILHGGSNREILGSYCSEEGALKEVEGEANGRNSILRAKSCSRELELVGEEEEAASGKMEEWREETDAVDLAGPKTASSHTGC